MVSWRMPELGLCTILALLSSSQNCGKNRTTWWFEFKERLHDVQISTTTSSHKFSIQSCSTRVEERRSREKESHQQKFVARFLPYTLPLPQTPRQCLHYFPQAAWSNCRNGPSKSQLYIILILSCPRNPETLSHLSSCCQSTRCFRSSCLLHPLVELVGDIWASFERFHIRGYLLDFVAAQTIPARIGGLPPG